MTLCGICLALLSGKDPGRFRIERDRRMNMKPQIRKNPNLRRTAAALLIGVTAALTGCGKSGSGSSGVGTLPGGQYPGGGPIGGGPIGNGACVPITTPIGFQGNNIYFDSANIMGGLIPGIRQQFGQMGVGVGGGSGPYYKQTAEGTITMNIYNGQNGYGNGYPGPFPGSQTPQGVSQSAQVTGTITLSQAVIADIMYRFGGIQQPPYPNPYPNPYPQQQVCVSGIAMGLGHYNTYLYGVGNPTTSGVFLYLNRTNHGYRLQF